jgi:UDP:flavonoid glycosyltransferase YjiC (YdhE family)
MPSHYFHHVPLAWACRAAGHDVRVAAQPSLVDAVARSGLTGLVVGAGYDFAEHAMDLYKMAQEELGYLPTSMADVLKLPPEVLMRFFGMRFDPHVRTAEAVAADLVPFAKWWQPDVVVADPVMLAAPLAAEVAGAPLVHQLYGPFLPRQTGFPCSGMPTEDWPEDLQRLFADNGVQQRAEYAVRAFDPCPDRIQIGDVPHRVQIRYVPYNDSGLMPEWLLQPPQRPRVCVTLGTLTERTVAGSSKFLVQEIISALASLDVEIVIAVATAYGADIGPVPDGVRVVNGLPLHLVAPTCAAIVHHGGAGTMLTAAYFGVPQVAVSQVPDTTFIAAQMAATGAGIALRADETDVDGIKAAVSTVLSDEAVGEATGRLRDEVLAAPLPAEAVRLLEELV